MTLRVIRRSASRTKLVFIHGITSSDVECWTHPESGTYWPTLLAEDDHLSGIDVLSFQYHAEKFSGPYSIFDAAASLSFDFDRLGLWGQFDHLIFVAHSLGGILSREFYVSNVPNILDHRVKALFFLIASPTQGSFYADLVSKLLIFLPYYHAQLEILRVSPTNQALTNLDDAFRRLKGDPRFDIAGTQLVENYFDKRFPLRLLPRLVGRRTATAAFDESLTVGGSDHSSIAKVSGTDDPQYQRLKLFLDDNLLNPPPGDRAANAPEPSRGLVTFLGDRVDTYSVRRALEDLDNREVSQLTVQWPATTIARIDLLKSWKQELISNRHNSPVGFYPDTTDG